MAQDLPFFVSIPHSGEKVPDQTPWLKGLPEPLLMCDVDRFVDFLYEPTLRKLDIPFVKTQWHRYAADLNRLPEDVDASSVRGHKNQAGLFSRGFHWTMTTHRQPLMTEPMEKDVHESLVDLIYRPFHLEVQNHYASFKSQGFKNVYHLDLHSMPSLGTSEHRDPGEKRADVVISDCKGQSCDSKFRDLVIAAYVTAGFKVGYNWPYFGGRVTEQYGHPLQGQQAIQVEISRSLYMNEETKKLNPEEAAKTQDRLMKAVSYVRNQMLHLM